MKIDDDIATLEAEVKELSDLLALTVQRRKDECPHLREDVFEAPYVKFSYGDTLPPFRVCRRCGYAEEGWQCHTLLEPGIYDVQACTREQGHAWRKRGPALDRDQAVTYAKSIGREPPSIIRRELKP